MLYIVDTLSNYYTVKFKANKGSFIELTVVLILLLDYKAHSKYATIVPFKKKIQLLSDEHTKYSPSHLVQFIFLISR